MLNCIKESFKLTNKYIILATPLILFSLLSSLYILFSIGGNVVSMVIAGILFTLMLAAFLSGWFFMIADCVKFPQKEDPNSVMNNFTAGVGEYFLPVIGMIFNAFLVSLVILAVSYFTGMKFIGDIGITPDAFSKAMESTTALKAFLMSLSDEQLFRLNAWNILLFASMSVTYFLLMFYSPALFFKEKNPFKAFVISIKNLFGRKFFKNVLLFLIIFVSYFLLSVLTTIAGVNVITHFIFTLVNFYYLIFAAVLVYYYYNSTFV